MFCPGKPFSCSIWLNSVPVSWATVTWPDDSAVSPIFSLISLCDYFLLLCALVLKIQKEIFSSSIAWSNAGVVFFVATFFFLSFNSNFILFCKIKGEIMQRPRPFPVTSLLIECGSFFTFWNSHCFHFPRKPTSFHPLNFSATPVTSDSFLCFMATPGVAPGIQELLQDLGPKEAGWKHFPWGRCVLSCLQQWCERHYKALSWKAWWFCDSQSSAVWEHFSSCCEVHRRHQSGKHLKFSAGTLYAALSPWASLFREGCASPLHIFVAQMSHLVPSTETKELSGLIWAISFNRNQC